MIGEVGMNNYTRLAKKHGFDHEYEYRGYVKAKCRGKLGEFYLNRCDKYYIIHTDLAQKPDVVIPPIEAIPYGTPVHTGKSWMWLNMLIAEERAKAKNESDE